jgi:hypothetical protein
VLVEVRRARGQVKADPGQVLVSERELDRQAALPTASVGEGVVAMLRELRRDGPVRT